jgi:hypothetical protein
MGKGKNMAGQRAPVREPIRGQDAKLGVNEFRSRSGEILKFRPSGGGQFDIPEDLKEDGWSYQWQAQTIYGEPSNDLAQMYANGWRYVTSDSRVGKFFCVPGENADCILRGGLVLMERPEELTEMYIEETNKLTRMQYENLMDKSSDLVVPEGFESKGKVTSRERALAKASRVVKALEGDDNSGIPDED